jgi:parallel beta-helix repeat protein
VVGSLSSNPGTTYRIEFFSAPTGTAGGVGQAHTYLGFVSVNTGVGGPVPFSVVLAGPAVPLGFAVSATATVDLGGGNYGSTSEFAANVLAAPNTAPTITSNGGGNAAAISVAETLRGVTTVVAADANGDALVYSLLPTPDSARFTIDPTTGVLRFVVAPDFEAPADSNADNVYDITVQVMDGRGGGDSQNLTITVTDVAGSLVVTTLADTNDTGLGGSFTAEELNAQRGADGAVSLREAFIAANHTPGTNSISFAVAGTITLATALPELTDSTEVDATSIPGYAGVPLLAISGANLGPNTHGLVLNGGTSVLRGLAIHSFTGAGVGIWNGTGHVVAGNFIGTDLTGLLALGNGNGDGIVVAAGPVTIGGALAADRNVISGNSGSGITLIGPASSHSRIWGNVIGLNAAQTAALPNGNGVNIWESSFNQVGGAAAGQGNVIAGNLWAGVIVNAADPTSAGAANGNGNTLQGNTLVGNGYDGVHLRTAFNQVLANTFTGNGQAGVRVVGAAAVGNSVLGNHIQGNGALGLDLVGGVEDAAGRTANDLGDADIGANSLQNAPELLRAVRRDGNVAVHGQVNSTAFTTLRIELFGNRVAVAVPINGVGGGVIDRGEGAEFVGYVDVTTDANGSASFVVPLNAALAWLPGLSATATVVNSVAGPGDPAYGSTSEFSGLLRLQTYAAPQLPSASYSLQTVLEDAGLPVGAVGTSVAQLLASGGPQAALLAGVAITSAETSQGSWYFSTNSGSTWQALGAVSDSAARLLRNDSSTRLAFVPAPQFNGSLAQALTFRAWDGTDGSA